MDGDEFGTGYDGTGYEGDGPDGPEIVGPPVQVMEPVITTGEWNGQLPAIGESPPWTGLPPWPGPDGSELDNLVDPSTVTADPTASTVIGTPAADAQYWLSQGGQSTCAPTSVAMVLGDVLGFPVDSQEVINRAVELGLASYDENGEYSGLDDQGIALLMSTYGLDVGLRYGADLDDLSAYLGAGHSVVVAVDADEIWDPAEEDATDGAYGGNHVLVVTGIDPVQGVVFLNDSGGLAGPGVAIPIEQFADAWADTDNGLIATDLPGEQAAAEVDLERIELPEDVVRDTDAAPLSQETPFPDLAPIDFDPTSLPDMKVGSAPLEPVESVPDDIVRMLMMPFTFVVQMINKL